jgi:hypothetical protein
MGEQLKAGQSRFFPGPDPSSYSHNNNDRHSPRSIKITPFGRAGCALTSIARQAITSKALVANIMMNVCVGGQLTVERGRDERGDNSLTLSHSLCARLLLL